MAGQMLDDRQHAAVQKTGAGNPREARHQFRIVGKGAVADHVMGAIDRDIADRRAIDGDAGIVQHGCDQARVQPCRLGSRFRIAGREVADPPGRRKSRPFRRTHPRDAAAFLIDQDRSIRPPDRVPQVGDECPDLIGRLAVAAEQDEAEGIGLPEELAFFRGKGGTGAAVDDRGGKLRGGSLATDGQECTRRSVT